jgi:hypothetical protein
MPLENPPDPANADLSCDSVLASPTQPPGLGQLRRVTYWSGSSGDDGSDCAVHAMPSLVVSIAGTWLASLGASATEQCRPSVQLTDVMIELCQAGVAGRCQARPPSEVMATPPRSPQPLRRAAPELAASGGPALDQRLSRPVVTSSLHSRMRA